jgi:serine/threonine protein kinase
VTKVDDTESEDKTLRQAEPKTLGSIAPVDSTYSATSLMDGERYALGEVIGRGGMGEVWLARDTRIDRDVAVKVLRGEYTPDEMTARFLREARVQGRLEHPAIVPVHDVGINTQGRPFFVMKRLSGATLHEIIANQDRRRWSRRLLLTRLVDVCHAIAFAHERGVVHRDLKPSNIMLGDFGEVYVLDWGIAKLVGDGVAGRMSIRGIGLGGENSVAETELGAVIGTPGYMAPEQLRGEPVDHRADIYALGCILFEILTGSAALPSGPAAFEATLNATEQRPRTRSPSAEVPPELDDLCAFATAPDPQNRLARADKFAEGLQHFLDGDRDLARRAELANAAAAAAFGLLEQQGADARAAAMNEAGRALALDPSNRDAQAIIGRLLLEPPPATPPEVESMIEAARVDMGRVQLRTAVRTNLAYFLAAPLLFLTTVRQPLVPIALAVFLAADTVLLASGVRRTRPVGRLLYVALTIHCLLIASAAMLFSPFLVLPALAAISVTAFIAHPTSTRPWAIVGAHMLAVVGPLLGELLGFLPRTFVLDGVELSIHPWAIDIPAIHLAWIVTGFALVQLATAAVLVLQIRRAGDAAQHEVYVNAWHLRQLLPTASTHKPTGL